MPQPCASLAYSTSTGGWKITHQRTSAACAGWAGRSSLGPTSAPIRGAHGHETQRTTRPHHAGELSTMSRTAELEQHWLATRCRQPLSHTPRVGWQGQQRWGGGLRMEGGSMAGLPGVDASSRPCAPLDLPRSPARRAESRRFTIGPRRMYLWSSSALCDQTRTWMGTWRRRVSRYPCRWRSRAAHRRAAGGTCGRNADHSWVQTRKVPTGPLSLGKLIQSIAANLSWDEKGSGSSGAERSDSRPSPSAPLPRLPPDVTRSSTTTSASPARSLDIHEA